MKLNRFRRVLSLALMATLLITSLTFTGCLSNVETPPEEELHHTFSETWSHNIDYHWHGSACGHSVRSDIARHTYEEDVCTVCSVAKADADTAQYVRVDGGGNNTADGAYVVFGAYPQTKVADPAVVEALTQTAGALPTTGNAGEWTSYRYHANKVAADYMWYRDVTHEGESYRGVYFTSYRPARTDDANPMENSNQSMNGYATGTVHWFRYEPLLWQVMSDANGEATLFSTGILDAFTYHTTTESRTEGETSIRSNNYAYSNLRMWLNSTFRNTAFTTIAQLSLKRTTVDNSAASTGSEKNNQASGNTEDMVWLLSHRDATTLLPVEAERKKAATDYAACMGVAPFKGYCTWWLRSPYHDSVSMAYTIDFYGAINTKFVNNAATGVCPVICIKL